MIIFLCIYTLWWGISIIYAFDVTEQDTTLDLLGQWICLNLSSVLLPSTRNSIFVIIFKLSYEKLRITHIYMASLCFISVFIKLVTVIIYNNFEYLIVLTDGDINPIFGTIAVLCVFLTCLFTLFRKKCFEIFYYSHKTFNVLIIISASIHSILSLYYMLPAIVLYCIDIILRYYYTYKANYSYLKCVGNSNYNTSCIFINLNMTKKIKVYPGCFFFVCYKNISRLEWHPLSLVSYANGNLTFCAKDMGKNTWTNKLKNFDTDVLIRSSDKLQNRVVYLQGPYSNIKLKYDKYSHIIAIAGGIGVTPIISIVEDIILKNKKTIILFVWIVRHSSLILPFNYMIEKIHNNNTKILIYSTNNEEESITELLYDVMMIKPNILNIIGKYIDDYKLKNSDVGIVCCGPKSLTDDIIISSSNLNVDVSCESFNI